MTLIIFILLALFEIIFAVYCTITGFSHVRVRSCSRLIAVIIFIMLCLLKLVEWDLRWYLFGVLLLFFALKGLYALISKKSNTKQFRSRNTILKASAMILLFAFVLIPAFIFPQTKPLQPTGEYDVETAEFTYTSDTVTDYLTGGKRQVNVGFWYPKNADTKYPLIIFSHGAFGIKDSNNSAFIELASHGYVVCSIDHPGHSFYTKSEDGHVVLVDKSYMNEVINSNKDTYYTKAEVNNLIQKWMKIRTEDINLTIDTILQDTAQPSRNNERKLYQSIDSNKIGVMGHSMGAAASVQIGRERGDIDAVINIDGPYFSEMNYNAVQDEFIANRKQYNIPILNIYSDQVWVQLQDGTDTGVYAGNKISDQICTESYDVYLKGTKHLTLTDLSLVSPFLTFLLDGQRDEVNARESIKLEDKLILDFFDDILKGNDRSDSSYLKKEY